MVMIICTLSKHKYIPAQFPSRSIQLIFPTGDGCIGRIEEMMMKYDTDHSAKFSPSEVRIWKRVLCLDTSV